MKINEARVLLGFPQASRPSLSQVKAAYRKKAWDFHPDRVPTHEKAYAESNFKLISEAYNCLLSGEEGPKSVTYSRVVRTGVPNVNGGRKHRLASLPFVFIIFGTVGLGVLKASRAYRKQQETYASHNPFLP